MVKARLAALLTLALAAPARADEGMWMPQQLPDLAPRLAEARLRRRREALRRAHRPADGRDRVARRMQRVLRLPGGPHRDEPPLRHRRTPVQLEPRAEPARGRVRRALARGGAVERPGLARVGDRLRAGGHARRCTGGIDAKLGDAERGQAPRAAREAAHRPLREAGPPLHGRVVLRGCALVRGRPARDSRTCGSCSRRPATSATSAARPTTGCGRATPATSRSTARTWAGRERRAPYAKDNVPYRPKRFLKVSPARRLGGRARARGGLPGAHASGSRPHRR